jgi:hypothetical protein
VQFTLFLHWKSCNTAKCVFFFACEMFDSLTWLFLQFSIVKVKGMVEIKLNLWCTIKACALEKPCIFLVLHLYFPSRHWMALLWYFPLLEEYFMHQRVLHLSLVICLWVHHYCKIFLGPREKCFSNVWCWKDISSLIVNISSDRVLCRRVNAFVVSQGKMVFIIVVVCIVEMCY